VTTLRLAAAALGACLLVTSCGSVPDTTLRPAPAKVEFVAAQHPLAGATLPVDPVTVATKWQKTHRGATWLDPITRQPQARWLTAAQDVDDLPAYLSAVQQQGAVPVLVLYAVPNRDCSGFKAGLPYADYDRAPRPDSYHALVTRLVNVLGPTRAVIVLEPDAIPADCYDTDRARTLRNAVNQLTAAKQYVYLDAGHPRWVQSGPLAQRLLDSGVDRAEGVSLNVSNRYPTPVVAEFGEELSQLIGGRDYLVDTSRNGASTSTDDLAYDWCNRPGQGLGVQRTGTTDPVAFPHLAAQLWIKPPGESDGNNQVFPNQDCHGEAAMPGEFSPKQARELILNDPTQPGEVHEAARRVPV
jgi:endoglucanase